MWTDAPLPRRPLRTTVPSGAEVAELEDGASVSRLAVRNPTGTSFLLLTGTLLAGGWQHRVVVHTTCVEAGHDVEVEVRCVEQHRWGGGSEQRVHRRRAPLAVRGALSGVRRPGQHRAGPCPLGTEDRADQVDVWQRVARYEGALGASPSPSSSLVTATAGLDRQARTLARSVRPLPGQRGLVVGIAGHPALLEVFDHPRALERQWEALLGGVLADAVLAPEAVTPAWRARAFAVRVSELALEPEDREGATLRVGGRDDLAVVEGLVVEDRLDASDDAAGASPGRVVHLHALNARHELVGAA